MSSYSGAQFAYNPAYQQPAYHNQHLAYQPAAPGAIPTSPNPYGPYYNYQPTSVPRYVPNQTPLPSTVFPVDLQQQQQQPIPRSPYRHIYDRKVHFDLPNTVQNPKSPIPGISTPNLSVPSPYGYAVGPVPSPAVSSASTYLVPGNYPPYYYNYRNPQDYIRDIHQTYRTFQDDQVHRDYILSLVKGPPVRYQDPNAKKKPEAPRPFFTDHHFNPTAFSGPFSSATRDMYYLQLVDFKGKDKNAPIREHLLLRPIRDGQLKDNRGILLTFVEQNSNNKSRGSQWALESLPDFDPTTSKDYIGYKNIGLVPNIERFMDLAVFVPVPLDGTPVDPTTNTIPLSSFQAWSAIVFMEARMRNFLIPQPR